MAQPDTETTLSWSDIAEHYDTLTSDETADSIYLREHGLKAGVLSLLGSPDNQRILDIGQGAGWLRHVAPEAFGVDIAQYNTAPTNRFAQADAGALPWKTDTFDTVVSSLVLMFTRDLDGALHEMWRVTRPGGHAVIAITHPYFYRTGTPGPGGTYTIDQHLSTEHPNTIYIGGRVGPIEYHQRRLDTYLTAIARHRWHIREVRDWFIDRTHYQAHAGTSAVARTDKTPLYQFIAATKPLK